MMIKRLFAASLLCVLAGFPLFSQTRQDVVIAVQPTSGQGGAPSDPRFFTDMTTMEVMARGYTVSDVEPDFILSGAISRNRDMESSGGAPWYSFHLTMRESASGRVVVEQDVFYQRSSEVNEIFPLLVFNMLASIPMTKLGSSGAGVSSGEGGSPGEGESSVEYVYLSPEAAQARQTPQYWLHLGLRLGGSLRFYSRPQSGSFIEKDTHSFLNGNAALEVSFQFHPLFAAQGEAIFSNDYAPYKAYQNTGASLVVRDDPFISYSIMFPLSFKFTIRDEPLFAAALGGLYYALPLGEMRNNTLGGSFAYSLTLPLGYMLGINIGMKTGPGRLFLDLRWAQDIGETIKTGTQEPVYRRCMLILALGYEMGFFRKKPKAQAPTDTDGKSP
jgi:hypothetical protein